MILTPTMLVDLFTFSNSLCIIKRSNTVACQTRLVSELL